MDNGQAHEERGSLALFALRGNRSSVRFNDGLDDKETETGPLDFCRTFQATELRE